MWTPEVLQILAASICGEEVATELLHAQKSVSNPALCDALAATVEVSNYVGPAITTYRSYQYMILSTVQVC